MKAEVSPNSMFWLLIDDNRTLFYPRICSNCPWWRKSVLFGSNASWMCTQISEKNILRTTVNFADFFGSTEFGLKTGFPEDYCALKSGYRKDTVHWKQATRKRNLRTAVSLPGGQFWVHSIFPEAMFQCTVFFRVASFECTLFFRVANFQCTTSTRISGFCLILRGKVPRIWIKIYLWTQQNELFHI